MYRVATIKTGLIDLIGWRQPDNPQTRLIENSLTESTSGKYFQDEHPVLTIENLLSVAPHYTQYSYDTWAVETDYVIGDVVVKIISTITYYFICIVDHTGKDPEIHGDYDHEYPDFGQEDTDPEYWEAADPFSKWLRQKTGASIVKAFESWLEEKQMEKTAKTLIREKMVFDCTGRFEDTETNNNKWAGLELNIPKNIGSLTILDRVGVQFTSNETVTLYLYHSSSKTAITSKEITYTGAGSAQWFDLDFELEYKEKGGSYYLVYDQNILTGEAINSILDYSATEGSLYDTTKLLAKYVSIAPFTVVKTSAMWDIADNLYNYTENYGLNLRLSVYCDYTGFIIEQKDVFKNMIAKQVAAGLLREIAFNPNHSINRDESVIDKAQLLYEIDGNPEGRATGIAADLKRAIKAANISLQGLDKLCLPCKQKGVKYKTV